MVLNLSLQYIQLFNGCLTFPFYSASNNFSNRTWPVFNVYSVHKPDHVLILISKTAVKTENKQKLNETYWKVCHKRQTSCLFRSNAERGGEGRTAQQPSELAVVWWWLTSFRVCSQEHVLISGLWGYWGSSLLGLLLLALQSVFDPWILCCMPCMPCLSSIRVCFGWPLMKRKGRPIVKSS